MEDAGDHDDVRIDAVLDDVAAVAEADMEVTQAGSFRPNKGVSDNCLMALMIV